MTARMERWMFRIGEFSRLTQVSVKTLRHYDRLGLLEPARTDPLNGYRYYSCEQLPRLNGILALKDLGFSLGQVSVLLDEELSPAQLRTMLEMKRDEVARTVADEQGRLARLQARLESMEQEDLLPAYEIVLKRVDTQRVASVREVLPGYSDVGRLFGELRAYQQRHGVIARAWTAAWYDPEYRESQVDGEATFTTDGSLPEDGRVRAGELPAVDTMACAVHHGPFDTVSRAYSALMAWIEGGGYRILGPHRELYLRSGNEQNNQEYVTEIQFPVVSADSSGGQR
jgi:DNA-binding transcriptional MerR regulator